MTQDELDYFYGAFCDAGGAGPDENPEQISLEQLVDWFYKVEYRFKTKDLKRDNNILRDNILSVHYFDEQNAAVDDEGGIIDKGLLQPTKLSTELEGRSIAQTNENGETEVTAYGGEGGGNNVNMSAKSIAAAAAASKEKTLTKEQEEKIIKGRAKGKQTYMTFVDFVLCMWNFLSADEVVMTKNLWEYVEVGVCNMYDGKGIIPFSKAEDVVRVWHPVKEGKFKKNDNKRKKNKASTMVDELAKTCHTQTDEKGRVLSKTVHFGNFAAICKKNRSFTFGATRLQLDIMACLMGSSFWKRQQKFRQTRFGLSNLYFILRGEYMSYNSAEPLTESQMKQRAEGVELKDMQDSDDDEGDKETVNADPEELKAQQVQAARATIHQKKERMRLGKTIFLIDIKCSSSHDCLCIASDYCV